MNKTLFGSNCLHLDDDTRRDAVLRLKSAKGHLEGVLRMLEDPEGVLRGCAQTS